MSGLYATIQEGSYNLVDKVLQLTPIKTDAQGQLKVIIGAQAGVGVCKKPIGQF